MLTLTRKVGEKIYIGDDIVVTITGVKNGRVLVGVEAPQDVPIYRQEILPFPVPPKSTVVAGGPPT